MGLFGKGKGGGLMNVIRCDEEEYLVWKWRPLGQDVNSTTRENSIRYGSSLRVKDGEVAVFVYRQKNGAVQDFIVGPYDDTIKTANFPVLSSIVGMAFGGESPFQAEIYFMNLQGNNQIQFAIPYFDVTDPRLPDFPVPVSVHGTLTFKLEDYKNFIKLNRLVNFDLDSFRNQIKDVTQGKLVIGLDINYTSEDAKFPISIYNVILGESATSKLFQNVREKASLAYTARSNYVRQKSNIFIRCGIEIENFDKALEIIKKQLEDMKNGDFTEEDLENAKKYMISGITSIQDEQDSEVIYYIGQELSEKFTTFEEYAKRIEEVSMQDVKDVANSIDINTIYFLRN